MTEIAKDNNESELMEVIRNYGIDNQILEKKLATATEALKKISEVQNLNPFGKGFDVTKAVNKAIVMRGTASQALAEIGGTNENNKN